jgi:RNA polymerase sigma factor (sigma-70 family)
LKIPYATAKAFCAGESNAIEEVYVQERKLLYFVIRSIVIDEEDANDVYQSLFEHILEHPQQIKKPEALESYLLLMAKGEAIDFVRKATRSVPSADLDALYGENEKNPYLESYYPCLTAKENAVVVLHLEGDLPFRKIAALAKMSPQSALNAYRSALKKLKVYYEEKKE